MLAHAALVHAQFETIHPFSDGNGRTGRALIHTMLRGRGITQHTTVPVSAGLLTSTEDYYDALTAYRAGETVPIVEQMSAAALRAVENSRQLAADIVEIREAWRGGIRARSDSSVWRLLDLAISQPVLTPRIVATELDISERSARNVLTKAATNAGALGLTTTRKRDRVWQAGAVLSAMDAFAARTGRRRWG